ncbi:MAG: hypothetical protein ACREU9_11115 [Gammaproteobacteria bacterium]
MDELETVYGTKQIPMVVGGKTLEVVPLTVGQLPAFARAIRSLAPALQGGEADWLGLLAEHGESMIAAVGIATGLKHEDLAGLPPDEFVALAAALMEVNMDFFVRRLTPAVNAAAEKIVTVSGAGATRSKP